MRAHIPVITATDALRRRVRMRQAELEQFVVRRLLPLVRDSSIRRTAHFQEWWRSPMNYVRAMELPIALELLEVHDGCRVMDIGSPKLLSLYLLARRRTRLVVSDIDSYFGGDFRCFNNAFDADAGLAICDARNLPFGGAAFDRIFAVSALEHIPDGGHVRALSEVRRVLQPEGSAVISVPAAPALTEEWHRTPDFYWQHASVEDDTGAAFYQTRFHTRSFCAALQSAGLQPDLIVCLAERPLRPARRADDGRYLHNFHYLRAGTGMRVARFAGRHLRIPLLPYLLERRASRRHHYLATTPDDPNIRQIVARVRPMADQHA